MQTIILTGCNFDSFPYSIQYQYGQPPYSGNVANLIRIILNSLEAHFHQCKRIPATIVMDFLPSNKSRGNFSAFLFPNLIF